MYVCMYVIYIYISIYRIYRLIGFRASGFGLGFSIGETVIKLRAKGLGCTMKA